MTLDRATVEQWLKQARTEGRTNGVRAFIPLAEDWLRKEEALREFRSTLEAISQQLRREGYIALANRIAALAPQTEEWSPPRAEIERRAARPRVPGSRPQTEEKP